MHTSTEGAACARSASATGSTKESVLLNLLGVEADRLQLVVTPARLESVFNLQMIDSHDTGFVCFPTATKPIGVLQVSRPAMET